ncbi:MAG: hypothetical protein WD512_13705 [Candidatus Paceibacterota bacterium]
MTTKEHLQKCLLQKALFQKTRDEKKRSLDLITAQKYVFHSNNMVKSTVTEIKNLIELDEDYQKARKEFEDANRHFIHVWDFVRFYFSIIPLEKNLEDEQELELPDFESQLEQENDIPDFDKQVDYVCAQLKAKELNDE